jgi:hypothetical protein
MNGAQIAALEPVAEHAGVGEVGLGRDTAVLLADDMLDLAAQEGVVLVDQAVLA